MRRPRGLPACPRLWPLLALPGRGLFVPELRPGAAGGAAPIKFVTVDTRDARREIPVLGVEGITLENAGRGRRWYGDSAKPDYYAEWLSNASLDPGLLVALVDVDVLYGGCGLEFMARQFERYTRLSGARVVGGAEMGIWPDGDPAMRLRYARLDGRVNATLAAFGLDGGAYARHAWCPMWGGAPCGDRPALKHLNSGFLMGRVHDLREVVGAAQAVKRFMSDPEDQRAWSLFYLVHDNKMTLDYSGTLAIAMYGLTPWEVLEAKNGTLVNRVTGRPACLTHWNGQSRGFPGLFLAHLPFNDTSLKHW